MFKVEKKAIPTPIHVLRPLQLVGEGLPQVRPGMAILYKDAFPRPR